MACIENSLNRLEDTIDRPSDFLDWVENFKGLSVAECLDKLMKYHTSDFYVFTSLLNSTDWNELPEDKGKAVDYILYEVNAILYRDVYPLHNAHEIVHAYHKAETIDELVVFMKKYSNNKFEKLIVRSAFMTNDEGEGKGSFLIGYVNEICNQEGLSDEVHRAMELWSLHCIGYLADPHAFLEVIV